MAENILGIVGQLDISDIYGSLQKMASSISSLEGVSKQMAQKLQKVFTELGNATEKELAGKSKEALTVLSKAIGEAKNSADKSVSAIGKTISKLQADISKATDSMRDIPMESNAYKQLEKDLNGYNEQLTVSIQRLAKAKEEAEYLYAASEQVNNALNFDETRISAEKLIEKLNQVNVSAETLSKIKAIKDSGMAVDTQELTALLEQYKKECLETARTAGEAYEAQGKYVAKLREQVDDLRKKMGQSAPNAEGYEELQNQFNELSMKLNIADREWVELQKTQREAEEQVSSTQKAIDTLNEKVDKNGNIVSEAGKKIRKEAEDTSETVKNEASEIDKVLSGLKNIAAGYLSFSFAKQFGEKVMQVRGQFQQLEVAFKTMLGSETQAMQLMDQLTKTAAVTPFDLQGVAQGAKQLLAYGVAADEVNDTLVRLGDIAAGLSLPLNDLVYLYGTTITQGQMFTQDLRQFMGRGIPIAEELAKQFGVTKDKVGELVTAGKVGADEFKQAIMSMSSEGGKFAGLMEAQSKTISGQISNIEDAIDTMFNNIGKNTEGIINKSLGVVSSLVENYERVGKVLLGIVTTYGAYKAAIIAVNAVKAIEKSYTKIIAAEKAKEMAATAATTGAKIAETTATTTLTAAEFRHQAAVVLSAKAHALLNATMLANPYVLAAVALGGLVAVMMNLKTEEERVNDALDEYNRKQEEAIEKERQRKERLDDLIRKAEDESVATSTREAAVKKLLLSYPSLFKKYEKEIDLLSKIKEIKERIAEIDGKNSVSDPRNQLKNVENRIKELQSKGSANDTSIGYSQDTSSRKNRRTQKEEDELKAMLKKSEELRKQIKKEDDTTYLTNLTGVSNDSLQQQINQRKRLIDQMDVSGRKYGKITVGGVTGVFSRQEIEAQMSAMKQEQARRKKIQEDSTKDFREEHRKQLKEKQQELKDWEKLNDPKLRKKSTLEIGKIKVAEFDDEQFQKELKKRQDAVTEAQKKVDADKKAANGGISTSKEKVDVNAAMTAEELAYQEKMAKLRREASEAQKAASIAAIKDNAERERAERKAQYEKTIEELKAQEGDIYKTIYEERKKAYETQNKGKKYENTDTGKLGYGKDKNGNYVMADTLNAKELEEYQLGMDIIQAKIDEATAKNTKSLKESIRAEEAANRDAINSYLKQYGDYAQKKQAIYDEANEEICQLEEQLSTTTEEEARRAIEARIAIVKEGTKKQVHELDVQYGKAKAFLIDLFEDSSNKSIREIDKTIKKYNALLKLLKGDNSISRKELVDDYGFTDSEIDEALEKLKTEGVEALKDITDALKNLKKEAGDKSPWERLKRNIAEAQEKIKKGGADNVGSGISLIGNSIEEITPELDNFAVSLGKCFNIDTSSLQSSIKMLKEFGGIMNGIGQIAQKNYIGGAMSIIGSIGSIVEELTLNNNKSILKELNNNISVSNERIERLSDALKESYGIQAQENANAKKAEIRSKQKDLVEAAYLNTKYFPSYLIAEAINDKYFGVDLESEAGKAGMWLRYLAENISPEELAKAYSDIRKNDKELWQRIINYSKDEGEAAKQLADTYDELIGVDEELAERILSTSEENIFDYFLKSLYDFADGSEDVMDDIAENWQKMVNRMVISNLFGNEIKNFASEWFDAYSNEVNELNKKLGEKQISLDDYERQLKQINEKYAAKYNEKVNETTKKIEDLRDAGLVADVKNETNSDKSAGAVAADKITYEQADQIEGQLTALQIVNEQMLNSMLNTESYLQMSYASIDTIKLSVGNIKDSIDETITLHTQTNSKLDTIITNTLPISEIRDLVKKIYDNY